LAGAVVADELCEDEPSEDELCPPSCASEKSEFVAGLTELASSASGTGAEMSVSAGVAVAELTSEAASCAGPPMSRPIRNWAAHWLAKKVAQANDANRMDVQRRASHRPGGSLDTCRWNFIG
jgi:hypothetical protein